MSNGKDPAAKKEYRRYFLEFALVALTTVENVLSARPRVGKEHPPAQRAVHQRSASRAAMIVLTALVAHASDSSELPVSVHVQHLREWMLATLGEEDDSPKA